MGARGRVRNVPQFGHARRADFLLADGIDHLNHGSFGATPRVVLDAADEWRTRMEADPTTFFRRDLVPGVRAAAERVAAFLGGRGEDWAFVENATAGLNAIIASLAPTLAPGDEILCLSQVYDAIGNALRYHAGRTGARIVTVEVPRAVPRSGAAAGGAGARDRAAHPARRLRPHHLGRRGGAAGRARWRRCAASTACRWRSTGRTRPGQIALDVPALGVDWYVGNLHKWAFAARGTGVIWCAPERQMALHPTAISHAFGAGFPAEFDYTGTRDNSAWLAVPAALDYLGALDAAGDTRPQRRAGARRRRHVARGLG